MFKIAAAILLTLSTCDAAAAQSRPSKQGSSRVRQAKADSVSTPAGEADEVERLLDRYVLAQGGVALFAIRSRILRARVEMSGSNLAGTFESYAKAPDKALSVLNAPGGQVIHAFDGRRGWLQSPWGGLTTVPQSVEDALVRGGTPGRGGFKWRSLFSSARLKGRALVEGRETVVLAATPLGGRPTLMYFDTESGLLRKQEFVLPVGGKEDELLAAYIDSYATVDGVKLPALFRHVYPKFTLTFRVYEIRHNVPIEDAFFASPSGN